MPITNQSYVFKSITRGLVNTWKDEIKFRFSLFCQSDIQKGHIMRKYLFLQLAESKEKESGSYDTKATWKHFTRLALMINYLSNVVLSFCTQNLNDNHYRTLNFIKRRWILIIFVKSSLFVQYEM